MEPEPGGEIGSLEPSPSNRMVVFKGKVERLLQVEKQGDNSSRVKDPGTKLTLPDALGYFADRKWERSAYSSWAAFDLDAANRDEVRSRVRTHPSVWSMLEEAKNTLKSEPATDEQKEAAYWFLVPFVADDTDHSRSNTPQNHLNANNVLVKNVANFITLNPEDRYTLSQDTVAAGKIALDINSNALTVDFSPSGQAPSIMFEEELKHYISTTQAILREEDLDGFSPTKSVAADRIRSYLPLLKRLGNNSFFTTRLGGIDLYPDPDGAPAAEVFKFFKWCQTHPLLIKSGSRLTQEESSSMPLLTFRNNDVDYQLKLSAKSRENLPPSYQLTLTAPELASIRSAKNKVQTSLETANLVATLLTDYSDYPLTINLDVQKEIVNLREVTLADPEIQGALGLDQLGGFGDLHADLARFVAMTIAYANGEPVTKPDPILLYGETGSGKTTITNAAAKAFLEQEIPVFTIPASSSKNVDGLIEVLRDAVELDEGGVIIINDFEYMLRPSETTDLEGARAQLLELFEKINQSRNLTLIANTEHLGAVTGAREAMAQTHRLKPIECRLNETNEAMKDLVRAVTAIYLSRSQETSIGKGDPSVASLIERRIPDVDAIAEMMLEQYRRALESGMRLTPGVVGNVLRDFYNNPEAPPDAIEQALQNVLGQRIATKETAETVGLQELGAKVDSLGTRVSRLEMSVVGKRPEGVAPSQSLRLGKRPGG